MRWPTVYSVTLRTMTYNPEWRYEDEQRVRSLECLYIIDQRDDPNHEYHHTYTGLWLQYRGKKDA
jgi:hypothetical protein